MLLTKCSRASHGSLCCRLDRSKLHSSHSSESEEMVDSALVAEEEEIIELIRSITCFTFSSCTCADRTVLMQVPSKQCESADTQQLFNGFGIPCLLKVSGVRIKDGFEFRNLCSPNAATVSIGSFQNFSIVVNINASV